MKVLFAKRFFFVHSQKFLSMQVFSYAVINNSYRISQNVTVSMKYNISDSIIILKVVSSGNETGNNLQVLFC